MSLLDKFKLKKPAEQEEKPQKAAEPEVAAAKAVPPKKDKAHHAKGTADLLLRPVLSEKGTHLAGQGRYVFMVQPHANKPEIKKVVETVYNVSVTDVRIVKTPGKMRRYGRSQGQTSAVKKAVVTLRPGDKIAGIIESVG